MNFTEASYDKGAEWYAAKFASIGPRIRDIDEAFTLVNKDNPSVVEIGCGAGREAEHIASKTNKYIGMDVSQGMLDLAKKDLPELTFVKGDIADWNFPTDIDIVFAFASLLHVDRETLHSIFERMYDSLNENAVVYLSLKRSEEYHEYLEAGEFGDRQFYLYTKDDVLKALGEKYELVSYTEQERDIPWFTMILRKK